MIIQSREFRKRFIRLASLLASIFLIHLIGVYIYEGGELMGVQGGSINIGIVGDAPGVPNPLQYTENKYHDLILKFLFRPMIRYDAEKGEYTGDIGRCDISNLSKITCEIQKDQSWSDGTKIQVEDVLASYQSLRENAKNEKMRAFLRTVSIVGQGKNTVVLSAKEKNSLMLDLLTYPIIRSDMLERIKTGRITSELYISSGPYRYISSEKNQEYGYERVTIERDGKHGGEGWLDKYNFLFFPDLESLERSKDTLSVILPPSKNEHMLVGPRFDTHAYILYEYFALFANTDKVQTEIRRQLYGKMLEALSGSIDPSEKPLSNIFGSEQSISGTKIEKNFSDVMQKLGYNKPADSIAILSKETGMLTGSSIDYGSLEAFTAPTNKKIYFSENVNGYFTLAGNVPPGVEKVYINNYALQEYRAGNDRFAYRVSTEKGTLAEGKNTYTLEYEYASGIRKEKESLTIYYATESGTLTRMKESVDKEYLSILNTPEKVNARLQKVQAIITTLQKLDPRYYYNTKNIPFSLVFGYRDEPKSLEHYATLLSQSTESLGIKTELRPYTAKDIQKMLTNGEKNYDYMIIGFEANGRLSRVGQAFASSEAKNGINFAKIESKKLDSLFAQLRVATAEKETGAIKKDISDFMVGEGFFLPISSPYHYYYIDKNLKGVKKLAQFQDISTLHTVLAKTSIKDTYILHTEGKSLFGFISWVFQKVVL